MGVPLRSGSPAGRALGEPPGGAAEAVDARGAARSDHRRHGTAARSSTGPRATDHFPCTPDRGDVVPVPPGSSRPIVVASAPTGVRPPRPRRRTHRPAAAAATSVATRRNAACSSASRSTSARAARSSSSRRSIRIVIEATRAIPCSSPVSSRVRPSGPAVRDERRSRRVLERGRSRRAAPAPGTCQPPPAAPGSTPRARPTGRGAVGIADRGTTSPPRTIAATSASSASAARSTASSAAAASLSAMRDGHDELGELQRRPGRRPSHPTERTTRVWLWKPRSPRVRAISP